MTLRAEDYVSSIKAREIVIKTQHASCHEKVTKKAVNVCYSRRTNGVVCSGASHTVTHK
jgi:hypothetical protein